MERIRYGLAALGAIGILYMAGALLWIVVAHPQAGNALAGIPQLPLSTRATPDVAASASAVSPTPATSTSVYIEVTDGCGPYYDGPCLNARSGPGTEFEKVGQLRTGMVFKTAEKVENEGRIWYKIVFDEWLRYPERHATDWYVAADYVRPFTDAGTVERKRDDPPTTKRITIDLTLQKLYAYEGDVLVMEESISSGLEDTPTPRGAFTVYKKAPTRYMQGPIPGISDQYYDLPGVPWNLYFTYQGAVIHGAYWHDNFGSQWSHGCVNLPPEKAKKLYEWADIGTNVMVHD